MKWARVAAALGAAVWLSGCSQVMTGGGFITSANGVDKANFGYKFDASKVQFEGTYMDKAVGVDVRGTGVIASGPAGEPFGNCMSADVTYESKNADRPG